MKKSKKSPNNNIAQNKKARHNYFIEETFEAGVVLHGWEVKSLRAGRSQIQESYVDIKDGELYLVGAHISALPTASTHVDTNPTRKRKLLMHSKEIEKLIGAKEKKGYTIVATALYWQRGRVKAAIALAKGKQQHDKRATIKKRETDREMARAVKTVNK